MCDECLRHFGFVARGTFVEQEDLGSIPAHSKCICLNWWLEKILRTCWSTIVLTTRALTQFHLCNRQMSLGTSFVLDQGLDHRETEQRPLLPFPKYRIAFGRNSCRYANLGGPHSSEVTFALLTQQGSNPVSTQTHLCKGFCECS